VGLVIFNLSETTEDNISEFLVLHPVTYSKHTYVFCVIKNISSYTNGISLSKFLRKYGNTVISRRALQGSPSILRHFV